MHRLNYLNFIEEQAQCALTSTPPVAEQPSTGLWPLAASRLSNARTTGKSKAISAKQLDAMKIDASITS